jgi:hypothetical protein
VSFKFTFWGHSCLVNTLIIYVAKLICDINIMFLDIIHCPVLDKDRTMDNIQKHNISTNVPSSQIFRSY